MTQIEHINAMMKNTMMETLDITFTDIGSDYLKATMPVTSKVHQPLGLLHGGASAALAESVGSTASYVLVNSPDYDIMGIELNINHLKSKREGIVTATAKIIHRGRTTHLWEIRITDENNHLIAICKLTNIILQKNKMV